MLFIVKLFPEITIKSPPVRKRLVKLLRDNLKELLKDVDVPTRVQRDWDKLDVYVESDAAEIAAQVQDILSRTSGIAYFSRVREEALGDMDSILAHTLDVWREPLAGKTFCVRVKRNGDHPFTSIDVERYVGGGLNQQTDAAGVRLKNPDVTVKLEIKRNKLYVVEQQLQGLGGFPLGSQEPVLSLISGGFDSTVSSYLTMRRGIRTHFCFFNLGGRDHEIGVKEVAYYLWRRYGASHRVMFVTVPFEAVVEEILTRVDDSQMGVVLKRMMVRAAERIAADMDMSAIVTGEAIGQVSSQTLTNLRVIDQISDGLILRPLIAMDKGEIIDIARRIGTEEFAAVMPEYCGVISRKPTTRARLEKIEAEEARFRFEVLDDAISSRRMVGIDDVMADTPADLALPDEKLYECQVIVDIRHPDEEELKPLQVVGQEVLVIPFYRLSSALAELDKDTLYLLYCEKGVMSQLHAAGLQQDGFTNIGVYRP